MGSQRVRHNWATLTSLHSDLWPLLQMKLYILSLNMLTKWQKQSFLLQLKYLEVHLASWKPESPWLCLSIPESERKVKSLSCVQLFATPWTIAYQAPLSMGFSRQEYWSGLPLPSPANLPDPGIEPWSPALLTDTLPSEPPGKSFLAQSCYKI